MGITRGVLLAFLAIAGISTGFRYMRASQVTAVSALDDPDGSIACERNFGLQHPPVPIAQPDPCMEVWQPSQDGQALCTLKETGTCGHQKIRNTIFREDGTYNRLPCYRNENGLWLWCDNGRISYWAISPQLGSIERLFCAGPGDKGLPPTHGWKMPAGTCASPVFTISDYCISFRLAARKRQVLYLIGKWESISGEGVVERADHTPLGEIGIRMFVDDKRSLVTLRPDASTKQAKITYPKRSATDLSAGDHALHIEAFRGNQILAAASYVFQIAPPFVAPQAPRRPLTAAAFQIPRG